MMLSCNRSQSGFTLIEAVMVIVITGILAVLASSFAAPLNGYFEALDRAELSDAADTALRRMARELRTALPNSVRVSDSFIEFLPTTTGGRYRKEQDCSAACAGDILDFVAADTSFDVIGALPSAPVAGQELVVYNTTPASAYAGANVVALTSTVGATCTLSTTRICFSGGMQFLFESPGNRFQIISGPVTFACIGNTLWRYSGYAKQAAQPTDITIVPLSAATSIARLATGVNCATSSFVYNAGVTQRADLVVMRLTLSNNSDSVTLLHQVHVQNVP
ncbi:prepilin-type N-terminal cleavage/methylation domain-containing protein [Methylobacter tundripaludum]|uniref:Type II secretory pathway pseudopilin PulG n=1 Tax=Methylobacter tundripaludum (strain ATCC BAA-1195 / DSM 17260 / SV96) TaxID=697282 RepID=G3IYP1_METTV|nr:prepilin-type N-terminal cleavage/methylation domain-containing protein [Methylobacter tundripaludum]EGW20089.1 type II secretory pathway pseudopilin PulG [Methylobacter tundripaludum SV96]